MKTLSTLLIAVLIGFSAQSQITTDTGRWPGGYATLSGTTTILTNGNMMTECHWPDGNGQLLLRAMNTQDSRPGWHLLNITYRSNNTITLTIRQTALCGFAIAYLPPSQEYNVVTVLFYAWSIYGLLIYNRIGKEYPWLELVSIKLD